MVKYKGGKKLRYDWQASSAVAEQFIRDMLPFLKNKHDEAQVALKFRERIGKQIPGDEWNNRTLTPEEIAIRENIAGTLKEIRAKKHALYMADGEKCVAYS